MMDGWYFGWVTAAAPDRSVVWFGWFGLVFGVWLGLVVAAAWIGLALVWLVDIRDHGHAHGSRRSELTII